MQDDVTHVTYFPTNSELYFRVGERDIAWHNKHTGEHVHIEDQKALVREYAGGGKWLANVGINYKLILNNELFPYVEQCFVENMTPEQLNGVEVKEHQSYGGRDCYREYIFHSIRCDIDGRGDVAFRVIVGNSYGSKAVSLLYGAIDFWCSNGMVIGASEKVAKKHTSGLTLAGIDQWIDQAIGSFIGFGEYLRTLNDTPITGVMEDKLFEWLTENNVMSGQMAARFRTGMHDEAIKRGGWDERPCAWDLYSAMTDWGSHADVRQTGNDHEANTRIERAKQCDAMIRKAMSYIEHNKNKPEFQ